jgi:transposase
MKQEQFYLGGDVSKGYSDFVIVDKNKRVVKENFQLDDTADGHARLYSQLHQFVSDRPKSTLNVAVESTGGYENNWYNSLLKFRESLNINVARLNPEGVHNSSKADLRRTITDKVSAKSIAEYLIAHSDKVVYQQQDYWAPLRKQWTFVKLLTKQKGQLLNQLESLLYSANPEILQYCRDGVPQWVLKLLIKYPTADNLAKAKAKTVQQIPYVSENRSVELVTNAKKSVASTPDLFTGQLVISTVRHIQQLEQSIKTQVKIIADNCSMPEIEILKSFQGIGDYSAIGLMLEIQSVARFSTVKKLASFFGIHPVFKASGDGITVVRMSKKGRREPRRILFMVAMSAIKSNPMIREIYQKHTTNGMESMAALGLCMHKILRVIYGMLKNNTPFDPAIDKKNQERSAGRPSGAAKDKSRRYQKFDSGAPVSRRQKKKREQQSQNACGGR